MSASKLHQHDQQPLGSPAVPVSEVSRRSFLKLLGVALAGVAFEGSAPDPLSTVVRSALPALHPEGSPLVAQLIQQAFAELRDHGLPFDLEQASVVSLPRQPHLIGMLLRDTRLPSWQNGGDIALTVDTQTPQRSSLIYVVGSVDTGGLAIRTTVLRPEGKRSEHSSYVAREQARITQGPVVASCRQVALLRDDGAAAASCTQWKAYTHWYYGHCGEALWVQGAQGPRLQYVSCTEYRNCRSCSSAHGVAQHDWYGEQHRVDLGALKL